MPIIRHGRPRAVPRQPVPVEPTGPLIDPHEISGQIVVDEGDYEGEHNDNPGDALEELRPDEGSPKVTGIAALDGVIMTMADQMVGRTVDVPANTNAGAAVELLTLRALDKLNMMFSVTLSQEPDVPLPLADPHAATYPDYLKTPALNGDAGALGLQGTYAILQWGAGAVQFQTVVDLIPGQTFTVGGSFLRILIVNHSQDNGGANAAIRASAFVSLLPKGSQARSAQYTVPFQTLPINSDVLVDIPPFARSWRAVRVPATRDFRVRESDATLTDVLEEQIAVNAQCPEIPINGTARTASIMNGAAGVITRGALIFYLDL